MNLVCAGMYLILYFGNISLHDALHDNIIMLSPVLFISCSYWVLTSCLSGAPFTNLGNL